MPPSSRASGSRVRALGSALAAAWVVASEDGIAQTFADAVRAANLGTGYVQMLSLASSRDFSAAHYDVRDDPGLAIDITRLPYDEKLTTLTPAAELRWRIAGAYFRAKSDLPLLPPPIEGGVNSRWTAYSGSAGLFAVLDAGRGFRVEPGVDIGLARLSNDASYWGSGEAFAPLFDNMLFNWGTDAWVVTPNIAMRWEEVAPERRMRVRASVAWSWIDSFSESADVIAFRGNGGTWSLRGEYAAPTGATILTRPLDWVASAGYSGFFGPNRRVLGFSSVAEVGFGLEAPWKEQRAPGSKVRVSASYLFGPDVRGWSVGVGLEF